MKICTPKEENINVKLFVQLRKFFLMMNTLMISIKQ